MTRTDLIFSDKPLLLLARHLLLWVVFGTGFYLQSIGDGPERFYAAFISLICFFPSCMLVFYVSMYFLVPRFLHKKKYGAFIGSFLLLLLCALTINFFSSQLYYALTCNCVEGLIPMYKVFGLAFINMTHTIVISGFVLGIKFSKNWYLQRKANQAIAKQKILRDLQLQRSRMYPGFIFHSMQKLYDKINSGSADAPDILLKLSDLLSYLLYESEEKLVPVEQELEIIQHLTELEKINQPGCIVSPVTIEGNSQKLFIRPMSLFSLLQNCFGATGNPQSTCPYHFHIQVKIENRQLKMVLIIEQAELNIKKPVAWSNIIEKTRQEWEMIEAFNYKLSLTEEDGVATILLILDLTTENEAKVQLSQQTHKTPSYEFA